MSGGASALPAEPFKVGLRQVEKLEGMRVRFPVQDTRYDSGDELPRLVVVQSQDNGSQRIAGTGWWGDERKNPELVAVEASPELVRAMARRGDPSFKERSKPATVRPARWWDVAIHARGFWVPVGFAFVAAVAELAGAAFSFVSSEAPLGAILVVAFLITTVVVGKAGKAVVTAARAVD